MTCCPLQLQSCLCQETPLFSECVMSRAIFQVSQKFFFMKAYQVFYLGAQWPGVHMGVLQQSPSDIYGCENSSTFAC